MASNFEVHRQAILEMQELVQECFRAYLQERRRRESEGLYDFFKQWPNIDDIMTRHTNDTARIIREIQSTTSESDKGRLVVELRDQFKSDTEELRDAARRVDELSEITHTLAPFWNQLGDISYKLRLCMLRSGSNAVVEAGEAFIRAVLEWSDLFSAGRREDELSEKVRVANSDLHRSLANALAYGPYNKLDVPASPG
jgi:hypothetical protein